MPALEKARKRRPFSANAAVVFGAILMAVGLFGLILPASWSPMSTATSYDFFHVVFGVLSILSGLEGNALAARSFLFGFGLIDLYQAVASMYGWFPASWFQWRPADDWMHWLVGAALVALSAIS